MFTCEVDEADEAAPINPYNASIKAPDNMKKIPMSLSKKPTVKINLEWVYGIRASKCRNGLSYLANGSLAYFNAGVGIVYDPEQQTQTHFVKHKDDINCIAFHPEGRLIATAETGKIPKTHLWDA